MSRGMTKLRNAGTIVGQILERPELMHAVRELPAPALKKLIEHVGLEDAGDLVALATTEQLERVFDEDLWRSEQAGMDETFDAERFALWLAVLVDQSPRLAARRLAELDEDLVTLALCRHLLVIDVEELAIQMSSEDRSDEADLLDKQLESGLYHEFEQYRVIARDARSWEAILAVLVELHEQDYQTFSRLLSRCCDISSEYIEDNGGLYDVLTSEEMIESDVAAEREERREKRGYVAPSAARGLLRYACATPLAELVAAREYDALTRAHFRAASDVRAAPRPGPSAPALVEATPQERARADLPGLLEALQAAEVLPRAEQRALSAGAQAEPPFARALRGLSEQDPQLHEKRMLEAAYLANVLLAGVGTSEGRLRPVEAAEGALALCELGAEHLLGGPLSSRGGQLTTLIEERDLVQLFSIGVHLLCAASTGADDARFAPQLRWLREPLRKATRAGAQGRGR